ncbi:MAG: hypothetical protein J0651_05845, partial [Actinobacteria bacterium]|nr:hypothetical protein [Actinomycetota bacterium]
TLKPTKEHSPEPTKTPVEKPSPIPTDETKINALPSPAPTPCEGRKWYIMVFNELKQCTNGYDNPEILLKPDDMTYFDTLTEPSITTESTPSSPTIKPSSPKLTMTNGSTPNPSPAD